MSRSRKLNKIKIRFTITHKDVSSLFKIKPKKAKRWLADNDYHIRQGVERSGTQFVYDLGYMDELGICSITPLENQTKPWNKNA